MPDITGKFSKRSDKVPFMLIQNESTTKGFRMQGFTEVSVSLNPKEYTRKYIDEESDRTDITGYGRSMSYSFDHYVGNEVQTKIVEITDGELTGADAIVGIVMVDMLTEGAASGAKKAVKRDFSVIPDSEGGDENAYTYSGNFKANGEKVEGSATTTDGWKTITFTESKITE